MNSKYPMLNIQYSKDAEIERVKYVYEELDWYREHGYDVHLPGGIKLGDCGTVPKLIELLHTLDVEFSLEKYEATKALILESWDYVVAHWPHEEMGKATLVFEPSYDVHLTRYGTGGSYNLPNEIVLNIESDDMGSFGRILFHEMIHLCLEPLVQKHETPHWYKERIVDLTFKKLMPEIAFEQNLPKEALAVDEHFARHYGDFDALFSSIKNIQA
jgi:hypothetical protein